MISRTSTQKYKSVPENLREVGQQLGVANFLEGSVQKVANAVHVNVQLIRAATDEHLWAESYNRKLDDVFGVEGEVANAIADQLNAKLSGAEQKAVAEKPTQNAAAYDAYLRAIAIDDAANPRHDKAGRCPLCRGGSAGSSIRPGMGPPRRRAQPALFQWRRSGDEQRRRGERGRGSGDSLQPELGEAWLAQGVYRYRILRDFKGALGSYEEALRRLPNSAFVLEQMAHLERRLGRSTMPKTLSGGRQLDPRNIGILLTLADTFQGVRRFDEARAVLDRGLEISPGTRPRSRRRQRASKPRADSTKPLKFWRKLPRIPRTRPLTSRESCPALR